MTTHHDRGYKPLGVSSPIFINKVRVRKYNIFSDMCKTEIYERVLNLVEMESEIGRAILQNPQIKTREVVDARYLLIYFLMRYAGFDAAYVARAISMTPQGVRQVVSSFDERKKQAGKIFEIMMNRIKHSLENN